MTMAPAIHTPAKIDNKACLNFIPKIVAASEPVQAPVTGRGIATNRVKPIRLYLSTTLPRRLVLSSSQRSHLLKMPVVLRRRETAPKNNSSKGTGIWLPIIASRRA